jgi:hypothetical protein
MPERWIWNWFLLAMGTLVAIAALVTLMRSRRDELLAELTAEAREQQRQQKAAAARQKNDRRGKTAAR